MTFSKSTGAGGGWKASNAMGRGPAFSFLLFCFSFLESGGGGKSRGVSGRKISQTGHTSHLTPHPSCHRDRVGRALPYDLTYHNSGRTERKKKTRHGFSFSHLFSLSRGMSNPNHALNPSPASQALLARCKSYMSGTLITAFRTRSKSPDAARQKENQSTCGTEGDRSFPRAQEVTKAPNA